MDDEQREAVILVAKEHGVYGGQPAEVLVSQAVIANKMLFKSPASDAILRAAGREVT